MNKRVSDYCVLFGSLSPLLSCLVLLDVIVLIYLVLFFFALFDCYLLESCSFLLRDRKIVDLEGKGRGKELGKVEER